MMYLFFVVVLDMLVIFTIVFFDIGIQEWSYPFLFYIQVLSLLMKIYQLT